MTIKEATYQLLYKKMLRDLDQGPSDDWLPTTWYDGEVEFLLQVLVNLLKQQPVLES
jgi:hypothetical protein